MERDRGDPERPGSADEHERGQEVATGGRAGGQGQLTRGSKPRVQQSVQHQSPQGLRQRRARTGSVEVDVASGIAVGQARDAEKPTATRSGRTRTPSKRLADYEVNVHGVECVQMTFRQIDEALTSGELETLVRVDPDPLRANLAGLITGTAEEAEAAKRHETRLRKAFADVFSEKLTQCPPLRDQNFSV